MDLEDIGGSEDDVEALEAGEAAGVVFQDHVGPDPLVTRPPHGDGVEQDGQARVGDGGDAGHDGLGDVLPLKGRREVADRVSS